MEFDIARAKELIDERERIDGELKQIFSASEKPSSRKPQRCSACGEEGHSARTCPTRQEAPQP